MQTGGQKFVKILFWAGAAGGVILLATLFRAYVLRDLWEWFVVPLGMPAIGLAHAVGISSIVGYLTQQAKDRDKDDSNKDTTADLIHAVAAAIIYPLFAWGIGAIAHSYMG
jgi:hypothetical protein